MHSYDTDILSCGLCIPVAPSGTIGPNMSLIGTGKKNEAKMVLDFVQLSPNSDPCRMQSIFGHGGSFQFKGQAKPQVNCIH